MILTRTSFIMASMMPFLSVGVSTLDRERRRDRAEPGAGRYRGAVHEPDGDVATGVVPHDVARAVAVEVAGLGTAPHRRQAADPRRAGIEDRRAVHLPDRDV